MAANTRRGEVAATIDGQLKILCLTLGALAELEDAFAVDDLAGLGQRFSSGKLSARDLMRVLAAGLRGGGNAVSDSEVAAMRFDGGTAGCALIVGELLAATFGGENPTDTPTRP
jgi:hypothetical protein